jgi:hypothetical protein
MADPTDDQDQSDADSPRNLRALLEAANERARQAEERAGTVEDLQRKLLVHEAGLGSLSEKQTKALYAAHEGDLTADGLKATAKDLGFAGKADDGDDAAQAEELEALDQLGRESSKPGPPLSGRAAFEKALDEFKGSAEEYDAFIWANSEYLIGP